MRIAETVTFGGSGLDRAAELRSDPAALKDLARAADSRTIALWRGKPLIADSPPDDQGRPGTELVRLPMDHPVLADAAAIPPILLGREDGNAVFAHDLSAWFPETVDDSAFNSFLDRSEQHHPALPETQRFRELRAAMTRISPRDAELAATARALYLWHRSHRFCARCGAEGAMTQAGWQRDCAACGAHHFPRTDPVVIMLITRGNKVLLGRSHGWPEGMYSLLAGFIEPGETIEAAVRREVWEEAGVRVGAVSYLASQPWPFPASLMLGCRGEATSDEITIDPIEIEDALWVTREEMLDVMAGQHDKILAPRKGAIAGFLLRNWLADRLD
ncbi:NAD(+) diphosphatase [Lutimaribacter sp. EGI FJ00015]|uniref:NAD(+) diphosphatase n=1 Tax=Lutimaribacter degradans TaxID=2945989 RepID=A0ACC5ZWM5_9RHOB|nr:NAD(+) diphosphatase [Lutimaribacter sp. EGI FJ00013]MCM2561809.1 NAD(+) diphosphatase [Lutimaribacter sp. EGI FJ00013]MCO0613158.1 NAD(+) diphosphatase [Lutimaribacter sp. EGI FJ00015]MCO0635642.1 NAD(+) diphosphatase [Lutimaribacter sp. EGI FJ00014]